MVDVKPGDTVKTEGRTVKVETCWNQGKHRVFKLVGGELVLDLHKRPDAEVVKTGIESEIALSRVRREERRPRDFQLTTEPEAED